MPAIRPALYCRVSTVDRDQVVDVQVQALRAVCEARGWPEPTIYAEEGLSGSTTSRPELQAMMLAVRKGQHTHVLVTALDRLVRSLPHLLDMWAEFDHLGVVLEAVHQGISTDSKSMNPMTRAFIQMMGILAELERNILRERTREGLAYAAKHGTKSGKAIGRPRVGSPRLLRTILHAMREREGEPGLISHVAQEFKVSRPWLYREVIPLLQEVEGRVST